MTILTSNSQKFCSYYQAHIEKTSAWYVVAILKSFDHKAFDRTLDVASSLFEFFVPQEMESNFLTIMSYFQDHGLVTNLQKKTNRLLDALQEV